MELISTIATWWTLFVWGVGALAVTALLALLVLWLYSIWFDAWSKRVRNNMRTHIWLYQAMREWERQGHARPNGASTLDEREKIARCARDLIELAEAADYVVTIHTEPYQPHAMGNHYMACEVRPGHAQYREST